MNDLDRLIATIPFGRENAIDRTFLAQKMGLSDRKTRQLIEDARNAGLFIINNSDGRGYYQTTELDEMERSYRSDRARALSILKRQKALRRTLKAAGREV